MPFLRKASISVVVFLVLIVAAGCGSTNEPIAENCTDSGLLSYGGVADLASYIDNGTLAFSDFSQSGDEVAITVTNNSQCELPMAIGAYAMKDNTLESQELNDKSTTVIQAGEESRLSAELPESATCTADINVAYDRPGDEIDGVPANFREEGANFFVKNLMANTYFGAQNDDFEENDSLSEDNIGYEDIVPADRFCNN